MLVVFNIYCLEGNDVRFIVCARNGKKIFLSPNTSKLINKARGISNAR